MLYCIMFFNRISCWISLLVVILKPNLIESQSKKERIAIIGGGIGGTSAAYELTNLALADGMDIEIDLYEPAEIGGRLATTFINGFEFETGGSIIHSENKYMNAYIDKFKLKKNILSKNENTGDLSAFYDGKEFVFLESNYELITKFKFWWRYGNELLNLKKLLSPIISNFQRIYEFQHNNQTFSDTDQLLSSLHPNFVNLLNTSIRDLLVSHRFHDPFLKEFVFTATNVNYNQDITDVHGIVGAVSLAASTDGELWSVQGGNKKVPMLLLAHSDARLIKKAVDSIILLPDSTYALQVNESTHVYDYVVIACPIFQDSKFKIKLIGFPVDIEPKVKYQKTIATFVHGKLNNTYFNCHVNCPKNIFSVDKVTFFNSISVLSPVTPDKNYDKTVFKIFSKDVLSESQLQALFSSRESTTSIDWFAYPVYDSVHKNLPLVLHDKLFYVNSIEWIASAMEMSAVSGVNSALYVYKEMKEKSHRMKDQK